MSEKGTCQSCTYFVSAEQKGMGTCRIHPPTYAQGVCGAFPIVTEYDWCGKYEEESSYVALDGKEPTGIGYP